MTKHKSTKRALLTSALALLVCVSMLIGSTFAWFTDSVTSSGNIIKSGTLDVTMQWKDATTNGKQTNYKNAADGAIFNYEKWEPGFVEAKNVKISNVGSLALKYQLNIIANGTVSELADVIDVYFAEGEKTLANRTDMNGLKLVGTLSKILEGMPANMSGDLTAGTDDTVTIALKMQESAGNEYQDKAIGTNFSVQLLATQLASEFDSFDNQYDVDATYGTYIELEAGESLLDAMASAEKGMPLTIKLNGDVEWATEGHHGENDVTPASSIVIDGNGNTITATGSGVTPLGDTEAPMTLKNVKIVDVSQSYAENAWEFTYLELGGTELNCVNVTFADEIQTGTNATFVNCTFESNEESVYAVWVEDGAASFTGCTFTGYRGLKMHEDYGTEISSVIVKDCTFSKISKKPGIAIGNLNADTTVSVTGSTFINCQAGDQGLYIYETDTDVTTFNFTAENNTIKEVTEVATSTELATAIQGNKAIELSNNVAYGKAINNDANIDLNGNTFEATGTLELGNNADLTMKNGDYTVNGTYGHIDVRPSTEEGSVLTFEDIDFSYNKKNTTNGPSTNRLGSVVEVCATATGAKTVILFKNCTFNNAQVLFEGLSGTVGKFEATFENCTFNALTSSAPIYVQNYVAGTINVKNCTFNLKCTSSTASAISISPSSSTAVTVNAENNTLNATAATPTDSSVTGVDVVKVNGTPNNIKLISISGTTSSANEIGTVKTGIAG